MVPYFHDTLSYYYCSPFPLNVRRFSKWWVRLICGKCRLRRLVVVWGRLAAWSLWEEYRLLAVVATVGKGSSLWNSSVYSWKHTEVVMDTTTLKDMVPGKSHTPKQYKMETRNCKKYLRVSFIYIYVCVCVCVFVCFVMVFEFQQAGIPTLWTCLTQLSQYGVSEARGGNVTVSAVRGCTNRDINRQWNTTLRRRA